MEWRKFGDKGESISHLVSACGKLTQRKYSRRHDNVTQCVHWQLCNKGGFERVNKWFEQQHDMKHFLNMIITSFCGISPPCVKNN